MRHTVAIASSARRDLKRIRGRTLRRIADAIDALADNPRPPGVVKLAGEDDLYRIRVGDYRLVYQIQDDRLIVLVVRIGHRREVYRGRG